MSMHTWGDLERWEGEHRGLLPRALLPWAPVLCGLCAIIRIQLAGLRLHNPVSTLRACPMHTLVPALLATRVYWLNYAYWLVRPLRLVRSTTTSA